MSPREPVSSRSDSLPSAPDLQATPSMSYHCFDVLLDELKLRQVKVSNSSTPPFDASLLDESVECPLFVTWEKRKPGSSRNGEKRYELRGCIGTLAPRPVSTSVGEYALISALKDRRFRPIQANEVPLLRVAVSLLVQYEECSHVHDWTVGVHGIMIRWLDKECQSEFSATYLPEVAVDQGWDQTATVKSLVRKSGYQGRINDDLLDLIKCTRYQSSKARVTFEDYVEARGAGDIVRCDVLHADTTSAADGGVNNCCIT